MRKKLLHALSALVLGYLGLPVWAQAPLVQPLPDPTPLPNPPTETPMPLANGHGGSASTALDGTTFVTDPGLNFSGLAGAPVAGTIVDATSNLEVDVYDLETTLSFSAGSWSLIGAAGARYVHMSQDYNLHLIS